MTTPSYTEVETFLYSAAIGYEPGIHVYLNKYGSTFINMKDSNGWTALMHAATYLHNEKILEILLRAGADIEEKSEAGSTAYTIALQHNRNSNATFLKEWPEMHRQEKERAFQQEKERLLLQRQEAALKCEERIQKLKRLSKRSPS